MNHELNARVAEEIMGWTNTRLVRAHQISMPPIYIPLGDPPDGGRSERVPDYSGSMDAAWEMEEEIERQGIAMVTAYEKALAWIVGDTRQGEPFICSYDPWLFIHATPEQRCRAALAAVQE